MATAEKWIDCYLNRPVKVQYVEGNIFSGDNDANIFGVNVYNADGTPATLTGTVSANIIKTDGTTSTANGSKSGNKASVSIPAAALATPGTLIVVLKITNSGVVTGLGSIVTNVYSTTYGNTIDPGNIMPSIESLLMEIDSVFASIPADYSSLWGALAPTFAEATANAVNSYVTYNGHLYLLPGGHAANTTWANTTKTQVTVGGQLSDLKSALSYKTDNKYGGAESSTDVTLTNKKSWNGSNGNQTSSNARACSEQITRTPDMKGIVCASGYSMTVMGNNSGSGSAMTTIDITWVSSVDLTDVTYKYLFISIKKSDGSNFDTGTTTGVISIKKYTEVVPYLTDDDLSDIESEIVSVESDIDSLQDAVFVTTNVSLVNNSDDVGSGAMANTRRWILPSIIPSGSIISNIKYHTASSISGTINFEIWKKNGDTLTLDKTVTDTPSASSEITVAINYTTTTDIMFGWRISDGNNIRQRGSTTFNIWATTDMSSSTLDIDDLDKTAYTTYTPCITVPYTNVSAKKYAQFPQNVITVGEGMDFEQIQDAIESIVDDSASKPYTLLIMPKGTPYERFSTLRKYTQTYPWNSVAPRYISIIGLDKKHCVIRSDSGNYKLPCGEPMLNGALKNLTFIMTNDDQDPEATQGGYCLHIDCRTLNDVGYNMLIEDCDFEDESGPCLGIGMHKNCTLTIRRCNFKTTLSQSYSPHEGYTNLYNYGVIFCHTSGMSDATDQRINIEDCFGTCESGGRSLWIWTSGDYNPSTASFYYRLLRNVFWNFNENAASYLINSTLTADQMNFGNNIPT